MDIADEFMEYLMASGEFDDKKKKDEPDFFDSNFDDTADEDEDDYEKKIYQDLKAEAKELGLYPHFYEDADELQDAIWEKERLDIDAENLNMEITDYPSLEAYEEAIEKTQELHDEAEELGLDPDDFTNDELKDAIKKRKKLIKKADELDIEVDSWIDNDTLEEKIDTRQYIVDNAKFFDLDPDDYNDKDELQEGIDELLKERMLEARQQTALDMGVPNWNEEDIDILESNIEKHKEMEELAQKYDLDLSDYYNYDDFLEDLRKQKANLLKAQELGIDTSESDWKYDFEYAEDYLKDFKKWKFDTSGLNYTDITYFSNFKENFPSSFKYYKLKVKNAEELPAIAQEYIHKLLIDEFAEMFDISLRDFDSKAEYEEKITSLCQRLGITI